MPEKTASAGPKHCFDYANDKDAPECLRRFVKQFAQPAWKRLENQPDPVLWATLVCPHKAGQKHCRKYGVPDGSRVRVVMASRLGDLGINLDGADHGYDVRVDVDWLRDFSEVK